MFPPGKPAAGWGAAAGRLQVRVGTAQVEEAAGEGRMGSNSKTILYLIFCSLEGACVHVQLLDVLGARSGFLRERTFCESSQALVRQRTLLWHLGLLMPDLSALFAVLGRPYVYQDPVPRK